MTSIAVAALLLAGSTATGGAARAAGWGITAQPVTTRDLAEFLGVEAHSGRFAFPAGCTAARLVVETYRDGVHGERAVIETAWAQALHGEPGGEWMMLLARGDARPAGDAGMWRASGSVRVGGGDMSMSASLPAAKYGNRGGSVFSGRLNGPDEPKRALLLYRFSAAEGATLTGVMPTTVAELLQRTAKGDLMLVWLEGR
jgi:hypothetical protein